MKRSFINSLAMSLLAMGMVSGTALADHCQIVRPINKGSHSLSFVSNRSTTLRLTVPNRGWVKPSKIEAKAGRVYTVTMSGYPVKVKDMSGSPTGCNDQTINR